MIRYPERRAGVPAPGGRPPAAAGGGGGGEAGPPAGDRQKL
jgi:hypothetical protein